MRNLRRPLEHNISQTPNNAHHLLDKTGHQVNSPPRTTFRGCRRSLRVTHEEQAPMPLQLCVGHHQVILTTEDLHLLKWAAIQTREVHHLAINRTVDHLQVTRAKNQLQIQTCSGTQIL